MSSRFSRCERLLRLACMFYVVYERVSTSSPRMLSSVRSADAERGGLRVRKSRRVLEVSSNIGLNIDKANFIIFNVTANSLNL